MDSFLAALVVGPSGTVIGVDMTRAQLDKAQRLSTGDVESRRRCAARRLPRGAFGHLLARIWVNESADDMALRLEGVRGYTPRRMARK